MRINRSLLSKVTTSCAALFSTSAASFSSVAFVAPHPSLAATFALANKGNAQPAHPASGTTTTNLAMSTTQGNDEVQKALAASDRDGAGPATIFDKLLSGEWPTDKVHEDDQCLAFRDVNPQAPVHFLVIPKHRDGLTQLSKVREDQKAILGHLVYVAQMKGQELCPEGFRLVINDGKDGAQSVYHLHVHVMGGRQMEWPPG
uniref:HIT domain-containing protein n=2 Tax=Craspedostauros australis TaxID=1486917 RepID=A0A7R9WQY9_9STRA|mmetsp:Transcript_16752/g.46297  ORF Transcript_16752/g.46297 Transcript_16752/m.46297 type:complete len:202 (+) Transcript_16752:162-767(+)|eukprot:CAMPEP_0198133194 /NCGR_PEP_ID=MMETSP1442-20131203/59440_1 /TAXON_ID= /ORGANISM="Craspedostauros australis, Strain CCMP3328" /LENGTH=201 /DNA_ID=CAMNT_0043794305 /DNA_START=455 /DNA_END=1060 /DNA_ORIENTATION=-